MTTRALLINRQLLSKKNVHFFTDMNVQAARPKHICPQICGHIFSVLPIGQQQLKVDNIFTKCGLIVKDL